MFHADHDEFNLGNAIIPAFFGIFFCIAPIIIYEVVILETLTLTVTKLAVLLGFGAFLALLAEALIADANKEHKLQAQGLRRFPHNQELTPKEVAVIAGVSEKKVHRALGYQTSVPASVAREWLEGVQGIRCPPAEKKLAG
ncbi:hypothetical protein GF391_00495 [Candidatus Uhrbacteria bacterium]|nr:hypothetical protein [Candidatus Uhrbacteria bacterium]